MEWKWFVQLGDLIDGPLNTDEVQSRLQNGLLNAQNLIWGPRLDSWHNLQSWSALLPSLSQLAPLETQNESWHYAVNGKSHGPLTRGLLVSQLKALESLPEVMVWTKGMQEWAPLFEFHELLAEVGVNQRQFPRAAVSGKCVIKVDGQTLIAPLFSISEGGFGAKLAGGVVPGQVIGVELQCPAFREALHVRAEVRYLSGGVAGLKFTQISVETRGAIIQFIKQNQVRFNIKAA
jgi:hypothetical protein